MLHALRFWSIVIVLSVFATNGWAEVPNRSVESMTQEATVIVTGPVVSVHASEIGRGSTRIYTVKAEKVLKSQGDTVKVGDLVMVTTWHQSLMPGTVGSSGHRGVPGLGQVTTVYATGPSKLAPALYETVFPNGFQPAEPLFATEAVLKSGTPQELLAAAKKAEDAGAWKECETLVRKYLAGTPAPTGEEALKARRLLAYSVSRQARTKEAADIGLATLQTPEASEPKVFEDVWRSAFILAADTNEDARMVALTLLYARKLNTPKSWEEADFTLRFLKGPEAEEAKKEVHKHYVPDRSGMKGLK